MKIALIGTHGVGKTTLCFELAARLKRLDRNVQLVTEVARDCPLPINRDTTLDAQTWILHTQCARELAAAARAEVVVCDRSIVDNYAYLVHAMDRRVELDPWIERWTATYDGLFKIPIWRTPSWDGTRDTDVAFQREIDEALDDLIHDFGIVAHRLDGGDPDGWVDGILTRLSLPLETPQRSLFTETEGESPPAEG